MTKTPETPTDGSEGPLARPTSWAGLNETLKDSDGDRYEFFPLQQVADGEAVELTLIGEPVFAAEKFHGKFSILEADVRQGSMPYRLCVSGTRLAKALAQIAPDVGDTIVLTAKGPSGRERKWAAIKRKAINVTRLSRPVSS